MICASYGRWSGDSVAHGGATLQLHTGSNTFTRPSMGSWVIYGLGTENQNLPAYITLKPGLSHGGAKKWSSGFLPAAYQGTAVGLGGMPIENLTEPIEHLKNHGLTPEQQRYELDMIQKMNRAERGALAVTSRIWTLAFRPSNSRSACRRKRPKHLIFPRNTEATKKLYGLDEPETKDFGWQCLMARRLAERNVRFIQINHEYGPATRSVGTRTAS